MAFAYNQPGYQDPDTWLWQSNDPDAVPFHGQLRSVTFSGSGSKTDYNTGNYTFGGHRHRLPRFTDFEQAVTAIPASNTLAGWQAACDAFYPMTAATGFNVNAAQNNATLEMTGGPTPSGKWFRRQITEAADALDGSNRLRNFCMWPTAGFQALIHISYYLYAEGDDPGAGKDFRIYWTGGAPNNNKNMWTSRALDKFNANAEYSGGSDSLTLYSDQSIPGTGWFRRDIFLDMENGRAWLYVNSILMTDASNSLTGEINNWIGAGAVIDYILLGNTVDSGRQGSEGSYTYNDHYIGWAQPRMDFSWKRLEIANNSNYALATEKSILIDTDWIDNGDGTVTVPYIVNQGTMSTLEGMYLFSIDLMTPTLLGEFVND
jgi:hypothetical protein